MARSLIMAEELKVKALMDKLYECGKFYKPNIAVGLIKDNWKKNLTEEDGILLTKILYGEIKTNYKKRTNIVETDYVHCFCIKETTFTINDMKVMVSWSDGEREEDDNVMDFVGFFIRGKEFKRS
jgi:hypothetical protein